MQPPSLVVGTGLILLSLYWLITNFRIAGAFRQGVFSDTQNALNTQDLSLLESRPIPTIAWLPCGKHGPHPFECGRLEVPLDYARPEIGSASLSVMRLLADPTKRRGSLFTNPGGPGMPGTGDFMRGRSPRIWEQTGGEYDIVSWDIRGVNDTRPRVKCFETAEEASLFWSDSLWYRGVETNSSLQSDVDHKEFYIHAEFEDARIRELWRRCEAMSGPFLKYLGTSADARDVASLANAIDGVNAEINYWGFSYGSVIGQHVVALFPHRLGRIILDGNVFADTWSIKPAVDLFRNLLSDSDATLAGFARECAQAGPRQCALASDGSTESSILSAIDQLLLDVYDPTYVTLPGYLSFSSVIRAEIFVSLISPERKWQPLARYLYSQMGLVNAPHFPRMRHARDSDIFLGGRHHLGDLWDREIETTHTYWAITCSDGPDFNGTTTRDLFDTISESWKQSKYFGPMWPTEGGWPCHHWRARAAERVTNFRVKPKHPILLLSNEHDPITSIKNSYQIMNYYDESDVGLGIRAGYGHCSYSMTSPCLDQVIAAYLKDWTLPEKNMVPSVPDHC